MSARSHSPARTTVDAISLLLVVVLVALFAAGGLLGPNDPTTHSGSWNNGADGMTSNDVWADANGIQTRLTHTYGTYGFSDPSPTSSIDAVECLYEGSTIETVSTTIEGRVTQNGGSSWGAWHDVGWVLADTTVTVNVTSDFAGWSWSALSDANFQAQIAYTGANALDSAALDWLGCQVYYSPSNSDPVIDPDDDVARTEEESIAFNWELNATDGDNDPLTWSWSSDLDCTSLQYDNWTAWVNGSTACEDGTYWGNATVDDGNGGTDYANFTIAVLLHGGGTSGPDLVMDFGWTNHPKGKTCFFERTWGTTEPVTFQWWFGDGTQSRDPDPCHVFPSRGNYDVTLRAWDASNNLHSVTKLVAVADSPDPPPIDPRWPALGGLFVFLLVLYVATKTRGRAPGRG